VIPSKYLSDRIYFQLTQSSYRELAFTVQNTQAKLCEIQSKHQSTPLGQVLCELVNEVRRMAEYRLVDEIDSAQQAERIALDKLVDSEPEAMPKNKAEKKDEKNLVHAVEWVVERAFWRSVERRAVETLWSCCLFSPACSARWASALGCTSLPCTIACTNPPRGKICWRLVVFC
jgi:hypothetical protein